MMRVTLAAVQSAYLRWLEDDGAASLVDLTAERARPRGRRARAGRRAVRSR